MPAAWRSEDGRFAVRFVHLKVGWRYWAFESSSGFDVEVGLKADGYAALSGAIAAVAGVIRAEKRRAA